MTAKNNALLSAFVDGELSMQELDALLEMINTDGQARADYLRYQNTSDAMHGYLGGRMPVDLSQRISAALDDEAALSVPAFKARVLAFPRRVWKQGASLAAAASIGALAVVGVMNQPVGSDMTELAAAQPVTLESSNRWTVGEAEVEERLNNYLVDHNEYAGASGLFSYARVVSYGQE